MEGVNSQQALLSRVHLLASDSVNTEYKEDLTTGRAAPSCLDRNLDDSTKFMHVYDNATPIPRYDLLTVKFIQVLRDLLARRSYQTRENFMADLEENHDSARIEDAKAIGQIHKFKSQALTKIKSDPFDTVKIHLSPGIHCGHVPPEETFKWDPRQRFN